MNAEELSYMDEASSRSPLMVCAFFSESYYHLIWGTGVVLPAAP